MSLHDHPRAEDADLMIDCLDAVAAVHAVLRQLAGLQAGDGLVLPPQRELFAAYDAASPRARTECREQSVRLTQMARFCTQALAGRRNGRDSELAPAAKRLLLELDTAIARLFALLPAPR